MLYQVYLNGVYPGSEGRLDYFKACMESTLTEDDWKEIYDSRPEPDDLYIPPDPPTPRDFIASLPTVSFETFRKYFLIGNFVNLTDDSFLWLKGSNVVYFPPGVDEDRKVVSRRRNRRDAEQYAYLLYKRTKPSFRVGMVSEKIESECAA